MFLRGSLPSQSLSMRPRLVAPVALLAGLMYAPPSLQKALPREAQTRDHLRAKKNLFNYGQSILEVFAYWFVHALVISDEILVMLPCCDEVVRHDTENTTEDLGLKWHMSTGQGIDAMESINTYIMHCTGDPNILPELITKGVFETIGIKLGLRNYPW